MAQASAISATLAICLLVQESVYAKPMGNGLEKQLAVPVSSDLSTEF